jgi:hypothetical protein
MGVEEFSPRYNPIWMDPYENLSVWEPVPADAGDVRRNLGATRRYAEKMDLTAITPGG